MHCRVSGCSYGVPSTLGGWHASCLCSIGYARGLSRDRETQTGGQHVEAIRGARGPDRPGRWLPSVGFGVGAIGAAIVDHHEAGRRPHGSSAGRRDRKQRRHPQIVHPRPSPLRDRCPGRRARRHPRPLPGRPSSGTRRREQGPCLRIRSWRSPLPGPVGPAENRLGSSVRNRDSDRHCQSCHPRHRRRRPSSRAGRRGRRRAPRSWMAPTG